jgi:hypothetical protein
LDPRHFYADPDSTFHPDANPDEDFFWMRIQIRLFTLMRTYPAPNFQIKSQTLEKMLKQAHIPYILACHLQIDADPVPDPAYHFDAVPDVDPGYRTKMMRIRIHNTALKTNGMGYLGYLVRNSP